MLLDFESLVRELNLDIQGVLHIGAHLAEEAPIYSRVAKGRVWWVEAERSLIPRISEILQGYEKQYIISALVSDTEGEVEFKITNLDSMSSSIFEFGTHTSFSPGIVVVERRKVLATTIDQMKVTLLFSDVNTLVMDIQGAELKALHGGASLLPQIDYVYSEVNKDQVYVGCAQVEELDEALHDFHRIRTSWVEGQGWGDALYVRRGHA